MSASHMGAMLRERREELGISLEMAATATNIRARVLAVLEEGDYANFPPYGHAMGMISSYARYLETDPRPILQEFEREWTDFENGAAMSESAERTRRGVGRFGERVTASERPSQRAQRPGGREMRGGIGDATGNMHTKLDDEKTAEEDDRYKSGTVKVVGTRQTGDFHRIGARPPRHTRSGSPSGERAAGQSGRMGRGGSGESRASRDELYADRLFDHGASSSGETGEREHREAGPGGARAHRERASSRYSRYSSGRYTSRSGSRSAGHQAVEGETRASSRDRAGSEGTTGRRHRSAAEVPGDTGRGRPATAAPAVEGPGSAGGSEGPAGAGSAASGRERGSSGARFDKGAPNYFSVENLDRAERTQAERESGARRRAREDDAAGSGADGIVQRVVELVQDAFSERRTRVIAAGIAAFVAVVVIVAGVLISTAGNNQSGVIAVQGGAADTTRATSDPNSASATVTTTNGNPVNVSIDVAAGQTSLINVTYDDDNAYSGTAVGAWHREFLVTESLEATFGNPDAVTVTENGNPVSIDKNSDGTGKMSITIKTTSTSTSNGSADSSDSQKSGKKGNGKKKSSSSSSSSS